MAHFDEQLREELRDDLIKTVGTALRDELPKVMQLALLTAMDNQVFDNINKAVDRFFDAEEMDCWLSFDAEGPHILVGIGPGDCAASFDVELGIDHHYQDSITREQEQQILDQITGLRNFIVVLDQAARTLEARAKVFAGRVVPIAACK